MAGVANAAGAIAVPNVVIATAPMTAGAMNDLILKVSLLAPGFRHGLSTQRGAKGNLVWRGFWRSQPTGKRTANSYTPYFRGGFRTSFSGLKWKLPGL